MLKKKNKKQKNLIQRGIESSHNMYLIYNIPQVCWWFSLETTLKLHRPSSAAACWSGLPCSEPHASCPHDSSRRGWPQRTRLRCPVCGHQTGEWSDLRARQTTRVPQQSHNLDRKEKNVLSVTTILIKYSPLLISKIGFIYMLDHNYLITFLHTAHVC